MKDNLVKKIEAMEIDTLLEVVKGLKDKISTEANMVMDIALSVLETRIPEDRFIAICEAL